MNRQQGNWELSKLHMLEKLLEFLRTKFIQGLKKIIKSYFRGIRNFNINNVSEIYFKT